MKTLVPSYYPDFKCIAGQCRHSCCIGWEIDIDEDTYAFYQSVGGEFGDELARSIEHGEEPHFRLGEQERCPFLDKNNLCRIIINLGEEALCGICADHPRFRNFFASRTEIGLGLCCEAAAELILYASEPAQLIVLEDDGEPDEAGSDSQFFETRDHIIRLLQNRQLDIAQRTEEVLDFVGAALPRRKPAEWAKIYSSLERLDDEWSVMLDTLAAQNELGSALSDTTLEQLMVYFIYRHLAESIEDGYFRERTLFALLSTQIIDTICAATGRPAADVARMYSAEIEYSDENIGILLDILRGRQN